MEASEDLKHVEVSLIEVSGANPRKDLKGETFKDLKQSIAEHGILVPLLVRPKNKGYELVAGERRLTAARELKLETVPVAIRELDDHTARILMLLENLQREDLEPLEEAAAIEELLKDTGDGGMTQEELAKKLSKSQPWVANRLRLLKAPKELQAALTDGNLTPQHAVIMLPYVDYPVFKERIWPSLRKSIRNGEAPTVKELEFNLKSDLLEEANGEVTLNLDSFPWDINKIVPHFDSTGCDKCQHIVVVSGRGYSMDKSKNRICLNRTCFADRLNIAKQKFEKVAKEEQEEHKKKLETKLGKKITKSSYVDTDKVSYNEYAYITRNELDNAAQCDGCEFRKFAKSRYETLDGDSGKPRRVCLKPGCYRGKKAAKSRVRNKACRAELEAAEVSLTAYLSKRAAGLTRDELRYVCDRIVEIAPRTYGRGDEIREVKSAKKAAPVDLEANILRMLVHEELGPIKYSLDVTSLEDAEKTWPFKVVTPKPEAPKTKKVQEKRKKKGTGP
jgi:ParB/RepB/Spo0J family partition protein